MGRRIELACFALMLAVSTARGDILPTPDRGPPMGDAGGLSFAVQWVQVQFGPVNGPHYQKNEQVVVLTGCVDGQANCSLAKSRNLIGMEVDSVDGESLRPEVGMVRQIMDAFADKAAAPKIALELYSRAANGEPIKVDFARR
ncbi:MAG: hypothetical protein ACLPGW_15475 [Roseiarcus sp.]